MTPSTRHPLLRPMLLVLLVGVLAWVAHFTGPEDLHDDDQLKPAAYALDIIRNNRWIVQTDFDNSVTSKPPLYQWLVAIAALPRDKVDELALYLPSGIGIIGAALLACWAAAGRYGPNAGLCAGGIVILNTLAAKHLCLARTDALFTLTVTATAVAALLAWERGGTRRWTVFWLLAALATMTKGPLGLVLGAGGLLAAAWERKTPDRPTMRGSHLPGVLLFLAICGGWFALAVMVDGQPVIDKMIGRELVGHAVAAESGKAPFSRVYQPTLYFLARFLPWSPIAVLSLIRVWRRPAAAAEGRRLERFCLCWFVLGIVIFSIPGHQRADLLLPLFPAVAILVGRALAERSERLPRPARVAACVVASVVGIGAIGWWNHVGRLKDADLIQSLEARSFANTILARDGRVEFLPDASDLQYYLGVKQPTVSNATAASLLVDEQVIVLTRDPSALRDELARKSVSAVEIEGLPTVRGETIAAFVRGR